MQLNYLKTFWVFKAQKMHFLRHGFGILAEDDNLWLVESDMNKHARTCMMEDIYWLLNTMEIVHIAIFDFVYR